MFLFRFLVLVVRPLWKQERFAKIILVKGLRSYVKVQRHLFKSITEFLSFSSRVLIASQISWSNPTLLGQLVLLALPLRTRYHLTYPLSPSIDMPVTEFPVPIYPPTYQQENFAFAKVWDRRLTELHQVPGAEYQGPPQDMVERTFARFETPQEVLWLSTPNSILTDLVVFLLFLYLTRLTYDSHAVSMLLFHFHIIPHAFLTSFISVQCMAMPYFFPSILPSPCGCLMLYFLSISWPCLMHASTSCY